MSINKFFNFGNLDLRQLWNRMMGIFKGGQYNMVPFSLAHTGAVGFSILGAVVPVNRIFVITDLQIFYIANAVPVTVNLKDLTSGNYIKYFGGSQVTNAPVSQNIQGLTSVIIFPEGSQPAIEVPIGTLHLLTCNVNGYFADKELAEGLV
jgi:hypothetical protein